MNEGLEYRFNLVIGVNRVWANLNKPESLDSCAQAGHLRRRGALSDIRKNEVAVDLAEHHDSSVLVICEILAEVDGCFQTIVVGAWREEDLCDVLFGDVVAVHRRAV